MPIVALKGKALVVLTPTQTSAYVISGAGSPNCLILRHDELRARLSRMLNGTPPLFARAETKHKSRGAQAENALNRH